MKHLLPLAFLSVALLGFPGCGGREGDSGTGAIKIGVAGPMSGGQARNGKDLEDGARLAVEDRNAAGGVLGRSVAMVFRDDEAQDKNATAVASGLVDEGVVGVVGHFNSGCTIPASRTYHQAGIVTITPASTNETITERGYDDVFRVCGRDDQQAKTAADFIADTLHAKRVAIYDDKTAYGAGLADGCASALNGRADVVIREGFDVTERNFRPYLTKLRDANVDVWYFGGIYEQAAPMLIQARQLGIEAPLMSGDGVHGYQKDFIDKVGPGGDGTLTTFPDTTQAAGYAGFVTKYQARFHGDPGPYAIYAYAATQILLDGIEKAGSTDGKQVAAAIHAGTFDTPVGRMSFDEKGDVRVSDYYKVWVVKDGHEVLYGAD